MLRFMLPLVLGNVIQQFYSMADAFVVGRGIGVEALAAVGAIHGINFILMGMVLGFTQGISIVTAKYFGADDVKGVRKSFATCMVVVFIFSLVATAGSIALLPLLLEWLRTPAEVAHDAYAYMLVILLGIPATAAANLFSNIMRATGNSKSPFLFLMISSLLNVVLDVVAVFGFGFGVVAVALTTVLAQALSALLCWRHIREKIPVLRIGKEDWNLRGFDVKKHISMGGSLGVQSTIIGLGQLAVSFALNGMGSAAIAATTAAQKIDGIGIMPLSSLGITICTFVSQNYGAGKMDRIWVGIKKALVLAAAYGIPMGVMTVFFGDDLAAFFVGNDPAIVPLAHTYLIVNGLPYIIIGLMFIFRSAVQGLGYGLAATFSGVVELVMRVIAAAFLSQRFGYAGLAAANPLAWLGSAILMAVMFCIIMKKWESQRENQREEPLNENN